MSTDIRNGSVNQNRHQELIDVLREYHLNFYTKPDDSIMDVVDNTSTEYNLVDVFYELGDGTFPDDNDGMFVPPPIGPYATRFFEMNRDAGADTFTEEYRTGWEYRAQIAWPSFVRDVQFHFKSQNYVDNGVLDSVEYSPELDIVDGIDSKVEYEGQSFYVDLFWNSKKSRRYLQRKKKFREHDMSQNHTPLAVSWSDPRKRELETLGEDLYLYSDEHMQDLMLKFESNHATL